MGIRARSCEIKEICITRYVIEGVVPDDEWVETLEGHRQALLVLKREGRKAIAILDCAESYSMSARQRSIQAQWNQDIGDLERVTTLGKCFVLRSVVARGLLTAVNWMVPPSFPPAVVSTTDLALAWAYRTCESAGVAVPESVRFLCSVRLCESFPDQQNNCQ